MTWMASLGINITLLGFVGNVLKFLSQLCSVIRGRLQRPVMMWSDHLIPLKTAPHKQLPPVDDTKIKSLLGVSVFTPPPPPPPLTYHASVEQRNDSCGLRLCEEFALVQIRFSGICNVNDTLGSCVKQQGMVYVSVCVSVCVCLCVCERSAGFVKPLACCISPEPVTH